MLAARKLRDRAWEIHQTAAETRKIVLEGDADPEKYWRPANPREPSPPSLSFRIWKTPLQLGVIMRPDRTVVVGHGIVTGLAATDGANAPTGE